MPPNRPIQETSGGNKETPKTEEVYFDDDPKEYIFVQPKIEVQENNEVDEFDDKIIEY